MTPSCMPVHVIASGEVYAASWTLDTALSSVCKHMPSEVFLIFEAKVAVIAADRSEFLSRAVLSLYVLPIHYVRY
jgi:hypothetical protein